MSTASWAKTRDDTAELAVPDGVDESAPSPVPPLAVGVRREPETVARLHHEVGTLIAATSYAVNQLGQVTKVPHAERALVVLTDALREVSS